MPPFNLKLLTGAKRKRGPEGRAFLLWNKKSCGVND
jgi:hypothetical protein